MKKPLTIFVVPDDAKPYAAMGPADLRGAGEGTTLAVLGQMNPDRDLGRWAGAIGSAVLKGAEVRWRR